jgi:8-oxoguanine deaminase
MTPPATLWIRNADAVFGHPAADGVIVADGKIADVVPRGAVPIQAPSAVFDARGHVLLPGLINTHHHFFQTLTRSYRGALDKPLFPWLQALYPVWARLDASAFRLAVRMALTELVLSGCTTTSDHHYLFPAGLEGALDIEVEEARRVGLRVVLTRGSMSLSEEDGGLPPRSVVQEVDTILRDCERVVRAYHQPGAGAMVQIALAPCSPFSVTPALMRESAALAASLNVRLHTHLGETADENDYCLAHFGCRPVEYLERVGWLSQRTWVAHGIHFSDEEIAVLGSAGVGVAHCPSSNMLLASGTCRVQALEAAGCPVGLGVDGSASNCCSNLAQEVRQAFLQQRLAGGASAMGHERALLLALRGSAAVLGRDDIGEIAVGTQADLVLYSLAEPRFSGCDDPVAALVLSGAHSAAHVMVEGRWIVKHGLMQTVDLERLRAEHGLASRRLCASVH